MREIKVPQPQNQHRHKHSFWKRLIIAIIGLTIFAIGTILWILSIGRIISGDWSYILPPIFTFCGIALSLIAWLFPISSETIAKRSIDQPPLKEFESHKSRATAQTSESFKVKEAILQQNADHAIQLKKSQGDQVVVGLPTEEHPVLLCFAIDVSDTMIDSVVDHAGKTVKRWAKIETVLERFIYLGTAIVKDPETQKALPFYFVMAYGFGFKEIAYALRLNKKPGGAVRDLLDHPSLTRFPSAAQITDHWDEYRDHIISRKYTLDVLGDTPMCRALAIIRDRIQEELTLKDFTLPILLLIISDGNPTDGDPLPLIEELHKIGVLTLGCYLGNQDILNAKTLYEAERQQWTEGAKLMFRISSVLRNDSYITRAMFNYLEDAGWQPTVGVRLFAQINQTEALDSFLKILLSGFIQDRQV